MTARVGALFAGYGGIELALGSVLDTELAWVSENDKAASKVLARHWPDVPNYGDITTIDWGSVEPIDILTGGSPCQDISNAGKRAGMRPGTRSGLWESMREAIAVLRPSLVVWENVGAVLSASAHSDMEPCPGCVGNGSGEPVLRALGRVVGDLASLGYDAWWTSLRASDVGACHGRLRVFLFATPADTASARFAGTEDARAGSNHARQRVRRAESQRDSGSRVADVTLLPTPAVNDMGAAYTPDEWDAWTERMQAKHGNGNGHGKSLAIEAQRLLPTPTSRDWKDGAAEDADIPENALLGRVAWRIQDRWGEYDPAIARWECALGRPAPDPTVPAPKGGRRLNPALTEWMMGLPEGWITDTPGVSRNDALRLCGNGVVPQQCAAAFRQYLADVGQVAS